MNAACRTAAAGAPGVGTGFNPDSAAEVTVPAADVVRIRWTLDPGQVYVVVDVETTGGKGEHHRVTEVGAVKLRDGEVIDTFIRSTGPLDKAALHAHCRANMSPQKTPNVWVQVESFPLTGSGKIQKFVLRDRFIAGEYAEL